MRYHSYPLGVPHELSFAKFQVESSIWLPLNVASNGNASSSSQAVGVTKIAKSVIAPLAQQHVSVFMLSTYQTDFILVREKDLSVVVSTLEEEFNIFKEVEGEYVPVGCQDFTNGLQKNGKEGFSRNSLTFQPFI
ncbi:Cytosolic arginine sensor for mTORC1 subunit 1 [Goodea atripinnis]|uniref:Cytosolic arginine sensor for mTORC1 subunit 1 n=1 Tax=Goodea atripinnis TaxID=208336 RepID=A0ABV0P3U1_9TELE